jgi:hypothetical protein
VKREETMKALNDDLAKPTSIHVGVAGTFQ